jgi:hypothetical protein
MYVGKQTLVERLTRMSVMLVAAAAFFTFVDVQTSFASCGDYVMVGGHSEHGDPADSVPGVPVCKGPNCQRSIPLPVVPTKGVLHRPHSDAACCSTHHESSRPPLFRDVLESSLLLAEGHSLPLLRPPCL